MKRQAFTLAETLITLGIIGVVAAITIPMLQTKLQEIQTVSRLKETYSILSQAIKLAGEDYGYPEEWGLTGRNAESTQIIAPKIIPYIKVAVDCGLGSVNNDKCFPDSTLRLNGTSSSSSTFDSKKYYISLLNGTSVAIESAAIVNDIYMYFLVDTNGTAKPNTWGKDIFEFSYRPILGLVPSGHPDFNNTYKETCANISGTGYGCAYYVLNFGTMDYLKKK